MSRTAITCVVTGASGYVGGLLTRHLRRTGVNAVEWGRHPSTFGSVPFHLGQEVHESYFAGASALVHGAYDFNALGWKDILAVNVRGSEKLLHAARRAGVERVVYLSSVSAFEACRSHYGRAKFAVEGVAHSLGALVIRPGLVYGEHSGGVFGRIVRQVNRSRVVPLPGGAGRAQFVVHADDLAAFVGRYIVGEFEAPATPVVVALEQPRSMREIVSAIETALERRVAVVTVPWWPVWLGLRTLELVGAPSPFRSDSLIALIHQNPSTSFTSARALGVRCRPFELTAAMLRAR